MKRIISLVLILGMVLAYSCKKEEVDFSALDKFPPTIMSITPDGSTKVDTAFNVKVVFADGPSSPLSTATVTLSDSLGTQIFTKTQDIVGTRDSVTLDSEDIHAADQPLGLYQIKISATDKAGNVTEKTVTFHISVNKYTSKNARMYLAGVFNNWGALEMVLVAPYTWQAKHVDFNKGDFKFKNDPDWKDKDWGDVDCDGVMATPSGNTSCGYSGVSTVTFDDNTLKYTVAPEVIHSHIFPSLYLQSSRNMYDGTSTAMSLTGDNTWAITNVRLNPTDNFQLGTAPRGGDVYGGTGLTGKAALEGPRFALGATDKDGFYNITLNDKSLNYSIVLDHLPTMFLVGAATPGGWDAGSALPFKSTGDGTFEIYAWLNAGEFKYLPSQAGFDGDWGPASASATAGSGALLQDGESNASVSTAGFYRITLDLNAKTFTVTKTDWAVVGAATPGSWPPDPPATQTDTELAYTSGTKWEADVTLIPGEYKFRANQAWGINLGDDGAGGLKYDGGNLSIAAGAGGLYHIVLDLDPVNGYKATVTLK